MSCRPSLTSTWARPSITAVSVPGRTGCHVAASGSGRSLRSGLNKVKSRPRAAAASSAGRRRVAGHAARAHVRVLDVHAAEGDDEVGVGEDRLPGRRPSQHLVAPADDVGQQHLGPAERVAPDGEGVAADAVEEPVQLALRVVEAAGAGPAVGAAEDRLVAVLGPHARQLTGHEVEGLCPADLHEVVVSPALVGPRPLFEPAPTYGGTGDPRRTLDRVQEVVEEGRRVGVVTMARHVGDAVVIDGHRERAPVGEVGQGARRHVPPILPRPAVPSAVGCGQHEAGAAHRRRARQALSRPPGRLLTTNRRCAARPQPAKEHQS